MEVGEDLMRREVQEELTLLKLKAEKLSEKIFLSGLDDFQGILEIFQYDEEILEKFEKNLQTFDEVKYFLRETHPQDPDSRAQVVYNAIIEKFLTSRDNKCSLK